MLRVYRKADKNVYDTERFFNQNIKRFDIAGEEAQRCCGRYRGLCMKETVRYLLHLERVL